ncbi:40S ribosomal protein S12 [Histomonas meleagridis]|uniref:40S ribosomal protein S12 n=1 Tax=Histomonas meleagridis TaxID=135588 RepID=UPI00355A19BA|nr:40S ribosomal protein S12 [Histomonas meleagridis]KAH0799108.1 40S ribosomal protein S12 [Histomonas meleagridis]
MSAENTTVIENGLRQINLSGHVAKGFNCTVKAIIKGKAKLVFLADDTDNKDYKALITGLAKKNEVKLVAVPEKELLGRALGLASIRHDGTVRRQIKCGACAVVKYGNVVTPDVEAFREAFDPIPQEQQ